MTYVVACFSGSKDSTALVVGMIEKGEQLDEVLFCDVGMEFDALYRHVDKVKTYLDEKGVKFTVLKPSHPFTWYMYEKPVSSKKYGEFNGLGWPRSRMRWCTKFLKTKPMNDYVKKLQKEHGEVTVCVGLAHDEVKRLERVNNKYDRHPLDEWGWSEKTCLQYCKKHGYDWYDEEKGLYLYDIFDRLGCSICPFQRIDTMRTLRRYYPELWYEIGDMEKKLGELRSQQIVQFDERYRDRPWSYYEDRFTKEDEKSKGEEE